MPPPFTSMSVNTRNNFNNISIETISSVAASRGIPKRMKRAQIYGAVNFFRGNKVRIISVVCEHNDEPSNLLTS